MAPVRRNKNTPAERVADACGGGAPLARLLGLDPSAVRHWNGAGGGIVPARWREKITRLAKRKKVRVMEKDLAGG
jgi:hypothetical protein